MKTILLISHYLGVGGTEKNVGYLVKYLSNHQWNVVIYCIGPKISSTLTFAEAKITVINSNYAASSSLQLVMLVWDILKYIRILKPDILLSFLSTPSIVTILANFFVNIPHIASERNNPILLSGQSKFWKLLRFLLYCRLNTLVVQSSAARSIFTSILFHPPHIEIIKNAIEIPKKNYSSKHSSPVSLYFSRSKVRFLYLGRLEFQKGIDLLIQAFPEVYARLLQKGIISELFVVGSGSMKSQVDNILLEPRFVGIKDYINILRETRDVQQVMASSDVLVIPSRSEGFPNVLLEAWSFGLPVVASTQSLACTDLNRSSVLVYDNNVKYDLVEKMINISSSHSLRSNLIGNADIKLSQYDISCILPQWLQLLTKHASNRNEAQ